MEIDICCPKCNHRFQRTLFENTDTFSTVCPKCGDNIKLLKQMLGWMAAPNPFNEFYKSIQTQVISLDPDQRHLLVFNYESFAPRNVLIDYINNMKTLLRKEIPAENVRFLFLHKGMFDALEHLKGKKRIDLVDDMIAELLKLKAELL